MYLTNNAAAAGKHYKPQSEQLRVISAIHFELPCTFNLPYTQTLIPTQKLLTAPTYSSHLKDKRIIQAQTAQYSIRSLTSLKFSLLGFLELQSQREGMMGKSEALELLLFRKQP